MLMKLSQPCWIIFGIVGTLETSAFGFAGPGENQRSDSNSPAHIEVTDKPLAPAMTAPPPIAAPASVNAPVTTLVSGENLGACCIAFSCVNTTPENCAEAAGRFQGLGSACGHSGVCTGACCCNEVNCFQALPESCQSSNCQYLGDQSQCSDENVKCGPRPGACCIQEPGSCFNVNSPEECDGLGGTYMGPFTDCSEFCCEKLQTTRACCLGDANCLTVCGEEECTALGGTLSESGTNCSNTYCYGACCSNQSGSCYLVGPAICIARGDSFYGVNVFCEEVQCPRGACCFEFGCDIYAAKGCVEAGGTYQGDGTDCGSFLQGTCQGACCDAYSGQCFLTESGNCQFNNQIFHGFGTRCEDVKCPRGACCTDFGCDNLGLSGCTDIGGTYLGDGTECGDFPNPACQGACCDAFNGGCSQQFPGNCPDANYVFHGIGTMCEDYDCPRGACCLSDGGCFDSSVDGCASYVGSTYLGDGSTCSFEACSGACCDVFTGDCVNNPPDYCSGPDRVFHGVGTSCGDVTCGRGVCCLSTSFAYLYLPPCQEVAEAYCIALQGEFRGEGTSCETEQCTGACCAYSTSSCLNGVTRGTCERLYEGVYQGDGSNCDTAKECPNPSGGCCIVNGSCAFGTRFECALVPGSFYYGDNVSCPDGPCKIDICGGRGNCCRPHRSPGCEDRECCQKVCAVDPLCCNGLAIAGLGILTTLPWDDVCVELAHHLCGDGNYCAATFADLNGDEHIDLRDYSILQREFGGP